MSAHALSRVRLEVGGRAHASYVITSLSILCRNIFILYNVLFLYFIMYYVSRKTIYKNLFLRKNIYGSNRWDSEMLPDAVIFSAPSFIVICRYLHYK